MTTATDIRARYAAALAAARVVREEAQTELDAHLTAVAELRALLAELDGHSEPTGALQSLDAGNARLARHSPRGSAPDPIPGEFGPALGGVRAASRRGGSRRPTRSTVSARRRSGRRSTSPRWTTTRH